MAITDGADCWVVSTGPCRSHLPWHWALFLFLFLGLRIILFFQNLFLLWHFFTIIPPMVSSAPQSSVLRTPSVFPYLPPLDPTLVPPLPLVGVGTPRLAHH